MSQTSEGAKKGALTKKLKYGNNYYIDLGSKAGKQSKGQRYFSNPENARKAVKKRWATAKKKID